MKKPIETSEEFLHLMKGWQSLEDTTISSAESVERKTKNPLIKMVMELIRHDSEKHKLVQQMIIDSILTEAIHIDPEELDSLAEALDNHVEAEARSLAMAERAFDKSELFSTRFLLSYLIADETKHHNLVFQLNDLKRAAISTSTGAKTHGYIQRSASDIERSHGSHSL